MNGFVKVFENLPYVILGTFFCFMFFYYLIGVFVGRINAFVLYINHYYYGLRARLVSLGFTFVWSIGLYAVVSGSVLFESDIFLFPFIFGIALAVIFHIKLKKHMLNKSSTKP